MRDSTSVHELCVGELWGDGGSGVVQQQTQWEESQKDQTAEENGAVPSLLLQKDDVREERAMKCFFM